MSEPCSTCRHWTPPGKRTGFGDAIEVRTPDLERYDAEATRAADMLYGLCEAIDLRDEWPNDKPLPLAVTRDASQYRADLFTQAEFGCAMHERRTHE